MLVKVQAMRLRPLSNVALSFRLMMLPATLRCDMRANASEMRLVGSFGCTELRQLIRRTGIGLIQCISLRLAGSGAMPSRRCAVCRRPLGAACKPDMKHGCGLNLNSVRAMAEVFELAVDLVRNTYALSWENKGNWIPARRNASDFSPARQSRSSFPTLLSRVGGSLSVFVLRGRRSQT